MPLSPEVVAVFFDGNSSRFEDDPGPPKPGCGLVKRQAEAVLVNFGLETEDGDNPETYESILFVVVKLEQIIPRFPDQVETSYIAKVSELEEVWIGESANEAVGMMLLGLTRMTHTGRFNPNKPGPLMNPSPVTLSIQILTEQLAATVKLRDEALPVEDPKDAIPYNKAIRGISRSIAILAKNDDLIETTS
jgi:hypothetical protein